MACSWTMVVVVVVALVGATTRVAEGQSDCVSKLVPCAQYLNSTKPSAECCNAIRQVVTTQLPCLCNVLKNPGGLVINVTQALELPKHCNLPSDTSACNALAPGASSLPPPAVPGGNSGNGVSRTISWMGMPALLFVSAVTFFY